MKHACLLALSLNLMSVIPASADQRPGAALLIRTFNYAELPADQLAGARRTAEKIFTRAGIALSWIDCRVRPNDSGAPCTEPLLPGRDLMLRLMDRGTDAGHAVRAHALATSLLDLERREGVLMTVDLGPLRRIAGETGTDATTLLGRAVAHEIGHLLLGTAEHPRIGLMRALWSTDELRGLKPAHWDFSSREAAQMRARLIAPARAAN